MTLTTLLDTCQRIKGTKIELIGRKTGHDDKMTTNCLSGCLSNTVNRLPLRFELWLSPCCLLHFRIASWQHQILGLPFHNLFSPLKRSRRGLLCIENNPIKGNEEGGTY